MQDSKQSIGFAGKGSAKRVAQPASIRQLSTALISQTGGESEFQSINLSKI
jgi:hypothetical protein